MAPANPVDRTVQQAGKHRNKDKPKNPWTNKKTLEKPKIIWKKHKKHGKKNEKNGKHIKHTNSLERGCFREESLNIVLCFVFPLFFICPRVFPMFFVFPFLFFFNVFPFFGGGLVLLQTVWKQFVPPPFKEYANNFSGPVSDFCVGRHLGMQWNL